MHLERAGGCQDLGVTMPLTYRALADRLVALGALPADRAGAALEAVGSWASVDEPVDDRDIPMVLVEFGVAVQVHGEDIDDLADAYRAILETAAALSGGSVVVTDVAFETDESVEEPLTFKVNGKPVSWYEDHQSSDYLNQMIVMEQIGSLAPGGDDPRGFYGILSEETGEDDFYLLLTPEQAKALNDEPGLGLEEV